MINRKNVIIGLFTLVLIPIITLVSAAEPTFLTGSPMTQDWIDFNEKAGKEKTPKLVFLSTSKHQVDYKPKKITEKFSIKDKEMWLILKWTDVQGKSKCTIDLYTPTGKLYKSYEALYRYSSNKWRFRLRTLIKGYPPEDMQGVWEYKIFLNDEFVTSKKVVIGEEDSSQKKEFLENAPGMAFMTFFSKGKLGGNYENDTPANLARYFIRDYPEYYQMLPKHFSKEVSLHAGITVEEFIDRLDETVILDSVIEKYNLKLLVVGFVDIKDYFDESNKLKVYLIDLSSRTVAREVKVSYVSREVTYKSMYEEVARASKKLYRKIMKEADMDIRAIMESK